MTDEPKDGVDVAATAITDDERRIVDYYRDRYHRFGMQVESLDWGSRQSQQRRFEVLLDVGIGDGSSVLDVGSGLGDFVAFAQAKGLNVDYTGVDLTPEMVVAATERFPEQRFMRLADDGFESLSDCGGPWDYVIASGIFYLRSDQPMAFLEAAVSRMFDNCRRGLAFNSLSSWMPAEENEFRANPAEVVDFCRQLTPFVALRHDYHPGDFTVMLWKERQD